VKSRSRGTVWRAPVVLALGVGMFSLVSACAAPPADEGAMESDSGAAMDMGGGAEMAAMDPQANASVERGRQIVITHACGDCHGGFDNPDAPGWLAGVMLPIQEFAVPMNPAAPSFSYPLTSGPGYFITRPRNLTPDVETGIGRFTERQIFNAMRYGLRPEETPDVEITSTTPGEGNFPAVPRYLAPPMPWPTWRHMSDQELWDVAAYLKRGLKPFSNAVAESEGPPDFWAGYYADPAVGLGTYPAKPFPAGQEVAP
jgi:mono/diheme cytochrome c family protein